ncbi:fimbria/pilus outer membrane usher protein [Serratia marcescens]|uniref:fimbria/pilus outer membrane usher protein n=1 Tax=Serratia marcescens TaxID=615 RepID=UPI001F06A7FC|nr:fimbria/pilus outer membrane usher protein [Serratia marcescens]UMK42563.1 fimbrial biogenesis outer membrane usher protein [Serratia marcescens]WLS18912.1 fimbria/pilus outer membrane usher protein [Serratia marcescens]
MNRDVKYGWQSGAQRHNGQHRLSSLAWLIAGVLLYGGAAQADYRFSSSLLQIGNTPPTEVDLALFSEADQQPPGEYRVDIFLNEQQRDTRALAFSLQPDGQGREHLQPCLQREDLEGFGVDMAAFPALRQTEGCINLPQAIPGAKAELLFEQQQLKLSIPQAALKRQARGYVPPEQWDSGIPALLSNYTLRGANDRNRQGGGNTSSYFVNLRNGVNWGAWRLRHDGVWNRDEQGQAHWRTLNSYVQRDITQLNGLLTLGDAATPGDIFDSVPLRGLLLASVEEMYPDSLRGYSPVVRGIARSNAEVIVRQNGVVIDQRYVPPGAFEISDLYAVSGSGDLDVTIKESDGTEQRLLVPFASLPVLQREGRLSYGLAAGQYRAPDASADDEKFMQGTLIYGLPLGTTLYGGGQWANRYRSLAIGVGQNLGRAGALSLDVTQSWARRPEEAAQRSERQGKMWRLRYEKSFPLTGTQLSLAGYRHASEGYRTLQQAMQTLGGSNNAATRSRKELSLQQGLGPLPGSLFLSLAEDQSWHEQGKRQSVSLGYNGSLAGVSYGLNYSQNKSYRAQTDRVVALNVSVPLNLWAHNTWGSYGISNAQNGKTLQTLGVNGTALQGDNLNWGLTGGYGNQGEGENGNLTLGYRGSKALLGAGLSLDGQRQRVNYDMQGGVLLHAGGITLSQPLNDTVALVRAPGAGGVSVVNQVGVKTDDRGYAVVPYLSAYRQNMIALDPTTLADDVELGLTSQTVIPTRGAVVLADYQTKVGARMMMTLTRADGRPVPFGATASLMGSEDGGSIVGDGGLLFLAGAPLSGALHVQWGKQADQQCRANYALPETAGAEIAEIAAQCR